MEEVAFGRYRLLELIGEGGMGQVFKAHDTLIGRDVAIKVLPAEMAAMPGYRERFRREAQIAARLTEPHIIPIHDTGEIDGRLYLVMPVIEGVDVQTLLAREGPMAPPRAVRVIQQLAAALNVAHRNRLVHRDIKPSNALMTADEHVYLIDFGIAHDTAATRMTQTGMMVGTLAYMAPERFLTGTADARADVYALTCLLYECLTGSRPFPGDSMEQQIAGHLTMDPPRPSRVNAALPAEFDVVIARGMAKQPEQRYQMAGELADAAHNVLSGAPAPPRPPTPPPPVGPVAPTMPGTQHDANAPTQQAATLVAPAPAEPAIGTGRFACALCGVILASLATAILLVPWWEAAFKRPYERVPSVLMWLALAGLIPGIALLVSGRGRARADRTIAGSGLVALASGTFLARVFYAHVPVAIPVLLAVVAALLLLVPVYLRPTPALARGYLYSGSYVSALALIDWICIPLGAVHLGSLSLVIGTALGLLLLSAGAVARGWAQRRAPQPAASSVSAGRFAVVVGGVVGLAVAIAGLFVRRAGSLSISYYPSEDRSYAGTLVWLAMLGAIPGIALLVLGRGRARPDQTMTGCALLTLALSAPLSGQVAPVAGIYYLIAVVGLVLILISVFAKPDPALARGCLFCGTGGLGLGIIGGFYLYLPERWGAIAAVGAILVIAGAIARGMARAGSPARTRAAGPGKW
ncbi:serine/threonine protein kinase [Mycobacterium gordonae]|uniref:serine/threonine-protein kinase n=1 Tax=Mycobacterium gordonae TaxID=1778 RepID=UPI00210EB43B|nr:serine/threonine-protein kinase [Mycobacterium gordonae]MCQ4364298.1 serine/threonine protein kinase [Mycobacterium gordonae]